MASLASEDSQKVAGKKRKWSSRGKQCAAYGCFNYQDSCDLPFFKFPRQEQRLVAYMWHITCTLVSVSPLCVFACLGGHRLFTVKRPNSSLFINTKWGLLQMNVPYPSTIILLILSENDVKQNVYDYQLMLDNPS